MCKGGNYYLGHRSKVLNVAVLKGGEVCLDVKYSIVKWEEILSSLMFLMFLRGFFSSPLLLKIMKFFILELMV